MAHPESATLLRVLSWLFGWVYFTAWSISFYPQLLLNIQRKSTVGVTVSYSFLNISGFTYYSIANILLFSSSTVRREYAARNPQAPDPTVRVNDIFFALHALIISIIVTSQFVKSLWGFRQGGQYITKPVWGITLGCLVGVLWAIWMAAWQSGDWGWLDLVYTFGYCKMVITISKYVPQALSNYRRKSTRGWAIWQVLLDLTGGVMSIAQLLIDSSLNGDWSGVSGNPVKFALGQISILFDLVFLFQHYVLYAGAEDTELGDGLDGSPLLGNQASSDDR